MFGARPSRPRGRNPRRCGTPRCRRGGTACGRSLLRRGRTETRRRNGRSSAAGLRCCSCGPALDRCSPGQSRVWRGPVGCQNCLRRTEEAARDKSTCKCNSIFCRPCFLIVSCYLSLSKKCCKRAESCVILCCFLFFIQALVSLWMDFKKLKELIVTLK